MYKSPDCDQILVDLVQAGGETLWYEIHKLINLNLNQEELPHQWKVSVVMPTYKKGDKTNYSSYRGISVLSTSNKMLSTILLSRLNRYVIKVLEIISLDFDVTDKLLIRFLHSSDTGEENKSPMSQYISFT
jgi:hypothetical protein